MAKVKGYTSRDVMADYMVNNGQRFLSATPETSIIQVLSRNLDRLNMVQDSISQTILASIRESGHLNFHISNLGFFFCQYIKDPERLL